MKVKSSVVLSKALEQIELGAQNFVCAAIQDVETQMRWDSGDNIISKATQLWMTFKPPAIHDNVKSLQQWWPKFDPQRIEVLKLAIAKAKKNND